MDISVITPFYRGNAYMEQLFRSVRTAALAAPEARIELLLVNDSPDCPIVYEEAWVKGFRLRLLENEENMGIHGTRVRGLREAEGEFLWFLDQDDLLENHAFRAMLDICRDGDVIVANGTDQNPRRPGPIYPNLARHRAALEPRYYYRVCNQIVSPGQCLIRKAVIPQSWCEQIVRRNGSDDLLLWLLLFQEQLRWKIQAESLYIHVDTGENTSADPEKMRDSSLEVLEILQRLGKISKADARRFRSSIHLTAAVLSGKKSRKLLTALRYPGAALERVRLKGRNRL